MAGDPEWMTYVEAMPLIGCSHNTIVKMARAGRIRQREQVWRALPSLWREDVERVAAEEAERRREREERRGARPASAAPDDGHVWLSAHDAGLVLGMTAAGVRWRAEHGLIPHTRCAGRRWFRRDHVEQAAAARAFRRAVAASWSEAPGFTDEK